jgi:hypothetical protein
MDVAPLVNFHLAGWCYPLRFLFATRPAVMGQVLGIVYRCIATHLIKKAGFTNKTARTGAVTLIQRLNKGDGGNN